MPVLIRYDHYGPIATEVGRQAAIRMVRGTTRMVALDAQTTVPFVTGSLSRSQYQNVDMAGLRIVGEVGYRSDHAMAVHQGARPHVIRPRNPAGVLRFTINGRTIVTKKVNHPGYGGNPWLQRALWRQASRDGFSVGRPMLPRG